MDGEIWIEKRRKSHDAMKSSFIDAVDLTMQDSETPEKATEAQKWLPR